MTRLASALSALLLALTLFRPACGADAPLLKFAEKSSQTASAQARPEGNFLIKAESFAGDPGSWTNSGYHGALSGSILMGRTDGDASQAKPARTMLGITKPGKYRVWVRCVDFTKQEPGTRHMTLKLGTTYEKQFGASGKHDSLAWEDGGMLDVPAGKLAVQLIDSSVHYARFDALYLTLEPNKTPPSSADALFKLARPEAPQMGNLKIPFPAWAQASGAPTAEVTLASDQTRVRFMTVAAANARTMVQQVTEVQTPKGWVAVNARNAPFGYLLAFADEAKLAGDYSFASNLYESKLKTANGMQTRVSGNVYEFGAQEWLVPTTAKQIDPQTVELTAEGERATLVATWRLDAKAAYPKVTVKLTPKVAGWFSLGMFNGPERADISAVDYILCSKIYLGKFAPPVGALVREQASSNQMSLITVPLDPAQQLGKSATFGVIADPDMLGYRWAKADTSKFGLGVRSPNGALQPMLFAPLPAFADSKMAAGQSYTFGYYPITRIDGWFETFRDTAQRVLEVRDQKKNYYSSLTDAIFNIQDFIMMDWKESGWHPEAMSFAYAESATGVSGGFNQSSPLTMVQTYLLSEDANWYEQRAIPTLAYLLSRPAAWVVLKDHEKGRKAIELSGPKPGGFPTSIYTAALQMTQGQTLGFKLYGLDKTPEAWSVPGVPGELTKLTFLEQLYRYRQTGDPKLLEEARKGADAYIAKFVATAPEALISGVSFELLTTAPWGPALLSMYEVTGDQKYLDAATECARRLLAHGTWVAPRVPEGNVTIKLDEITSRGLLHDPNGAAAVNHGWNHTYRIIRGYKLFEPEKVKTPLERDPAVWASVKDETVPAWLVSRVGLNVEHGTQFVSYQPFDSPNISMNCFAPDFLRIATYTGDTFFQTVARSSMIARAANYPGYYINQMNTIYMKPDNPYKGPDVSGMEYTHSPAYLAMATDFLFTQVWSWSGRKIEFPWARQYSYAYFDNKVYGMAPGKFFDLEGMWPWLKRGLVTVDNKQIDWLAARKDGVFAAAFINQDEQTVEANITLGSDVTGGTALSGAVTVYAADGSHSTAQVADGKLTLKVPGRGLVAIAMKAPAVKAPVWAGVDYRQQIKAAVGNTIAKPSGTGDFGTGYVVRIDPRSYFAYTFVPDTYEQAKSATLNYKLNDGPWQKVVVADFPFDKLIKVDDPQAKFTFNWEVTDLKGAVKKSKDKVLSAAP